MWAARREGSQAPMMQNLLDIYAEQSRALLEQMQRNAALAGMPGFTPPAASNE